MLTEYNDNITLDTIINNPDKPWDWRKISKFKKKLNKGHIIDIRKKYFQVIFETVSLFSRNIDKIIMKRIHMM
jgi:hypothetical protein